MIVGDSGKYKKLADGLLVREVRHNDSGEYTCKAFQITEIMTNVEEQTIRLNVQCNRCSSDYINSFHETCLITDKPVMIGLPHKIKYGFLNGEVKMECDAEARPRPEFTWYRNGKKIFRNVENEENQSVLKVKSLPKVLI